MIPLARSAQLDVPFADLGEADLVVDAVYAAGLSGTPVMTPLASCCPVLATRRVPLRRVPGEENGTAGGSIHQRRSGGLARSSGYRDRHLHVLRRQPHPRKGLHETPRKGNVLLRDAFAHSLGSAHDRARGVPPFLLFEKATPGRAVRFRGLLAPGGPTLTPDDELSAIWRTTGTQRFQNYRARFTVLDQARVPRAWIRHVLAGGSPLDGGCPEVWQAWVESRVYRPLLARQRRSYVHLLSSFPTIALARPCSRRSGSTSVGARQTSRSAP